MRFVFRQTSKQANGYGIVWYGTVWNGMIRMDEMIDVNDDNEWMDLIGS